MEVNELFLGAFLEGSRGLLVASGASAHACYSTLRVQKGWPRWTVLSGARFSAGDSKLPWTDPERLPPYFLTGCAAHLPFKRHSFDALLSVAALSAARPPWTVLAEYHRVLVPDGKLLLLEPSRSGLLAALRDRVSSPGQRAFTLDELKHRLTRADFLIERAGPEPSQAPGSKPVFEVRAIKKENLSTPVPQFSTGRELRAKQRPYPKGEELP